MGIHQPRKGNIISMRTIFQPDRLARISLQSAYEQIAPIHRRALSLASKAEPINPIARPTRRKTS